MKKLISAVITCALTAMLAISHAQEGSLIPNGLHVITPENIDRVEEIASFGNGGPGQLYWSPDGKTLAMNNAYGVWLHDTQAFDAAPQFLPEPNLAMVRFSDDGTLLLAWDVHHSEISPVRVWDVHSTKQVTDWSAADISSNPYWRYQISVTETGPMAARHDVVSFWDIVTARILYDYPANLGDLFFSADHSLAAIGNSRNSFTFDVVSGEPLWTYNDSTNYATGSIELLSSAGDFILLNTGEAEENALSLHRASDGEFIRFLQADVGPWWFIGFTPDDRYIVGRSRNGNLIQVWSTETGELVNRFEVDEQLTNYDYRHWSLVDNSRLLVGSPEKGIVVLYDLVTGQAVTNIKAEESLFDYAYSPDGCCIATVSEDGNLRIWDIESAAQVFATDRYRPVGEVKAISPDGQRLITVVPAATLQGPQKARLVIWDVAHGQIVKEVEQGYSTYPVAVFRPDSKHFATNTMGPYSLEWDNWAWDIPGLGAALDVVYSPDGQYLAVAGGTYDSNGPRPPIYRTLTVYDATRGSILVSVPEEYPNSGGFTAVAFSPDGRYIAAESLEILVWKIDKLLAGDQTPVARLRPDEGVGDLAFSPDGKQLVAGQALLRTGGDGFASLIGPCSAVAWDVDAALEQARTSETAIESPYCISFPQVFGPARYVAYSPNGKMILIYGSDEGWQRWATPMTLVDSETMEVLRHFWSEASFVMSPDGTFMISEGADERLHYWGIPLATK